MERSARCAHRAMERRQGRSRPLAGPARVSGDIRERGTGGEFGSRGGSGGAARSSGASTLSDKERRTLLELMTNEQLQLEVLGSVYPLDRQLDSKRFWRKAADHMQRSQERVMLAGMRLLTGRLAGWVVKGMGAPVACSCSSTDWL